MQCRLVYIGYISYFWYFWLSVQVTIKQGRGYCTDSQSINALVLHRQSIWTKPLFQNRFVRLSLLHGWYNESPTWLVRGRNKSKISGSQQDYLVGKSGSPQIYLVVIWPRFKQNNMTSKKFEKIFPDFWVVHGTTAVIIFGSPTKFLVVLGLPDYHYFDPWLV